MHLLLVSAFIHIQSKHRYSSTFTYDAAVSRYEAAKAERERAAADIRQRGIRRREFERFITESEKLNEAVSEVDDVLRGGLVEYVTVG